MIWILRGLTGSGKSTYVEKMPNPKHVFSADAYHTIGGVYRFDPRRAGLAHNECYRRFVEAVMTEATSTLIVDNTNTALWELAPYVRIAEAFDIEYKIVYLTCSVEDAIRRNVHGVPHNTILAMNRNLITEIVPPHWKQEVV